jgi:mono/diheme cytochrome c family protein
VKSIKLSSIIICLLLVGLSPQSVTQFNRKTPPRFISGAVSTKIGFSQPDEALITHLDTVALTGGKVLFESHCGKCHSTDFVIKSGTNLIMVDSLVACMTGKAGFQLDTVQHSQITHYLRFVLSPQ